MGLKSCRPPAVLKGCSKRCGDPPTSKYPLWEGMITPLLPIPVRGVVWYQGEADSQNLEDANKYECQLKAMIADWRARFAKHPEGDITFTIVQISASGDHSGGALRLAQQAATALMGTSIVVTTDLFDATSPCGSVHIRNKSAVGRRAALASLASTYGRTERFWTGPIPDKVTKSNASITVDFSSVNGELAFEPVPSQTKVKSLQGFEATANEDPSKGWTFVPAKVAGTSSSVVVDTSSLEGVRWLRYSWGFVPTGEFLYDDGGRVGLPAGPFFVNCTGEACLLVEGGHVPGHLPPTPAPTPAPQPPTPTESNCTFQDLTTYQDPVYKQVSVGLYDYRACCELCHTDPECAVAQMHHGLKSATYDLCMLMASAMQPKENRVSPPALEMACLPSRSHAQIV